MRHGYEKSRAVGRAGRPVAEQGPITEKENGMTRITAVKRQKGKIAVLGGMAGEAAL